MNWNAMNSRWRSHVTSRTLYLLFLGQLISFIVALVSCTSSFIANLGVDAPVTQSFFTYFSLTLVYGGIFLCRRQRLRVAWYWYLLLGFVDVQANFLVNKAFQFSSITSVTLLDGTIIAWAIIFTWLFLGTRYSVWQFFSAAICILGFGVLLLSDAGGGGGGGGGSRPLLGDVLVIVGTIFYAMSNVGEEFFVKQVDRVEVVFMIGVNGLLVSAVQLSILELKSLESVKWSIDIILGFAGYAALVFMSYTLTPFILKLSGATIYNLSILTADMWTVVFRICFYHQQVDWLYFLSFAIVVIGLITYSTTEKDPVPVPALENQNNQVQYRILDTENVASRNESDS